MSRSLAMDGDLVALGFSPPVYPFGQGGSVVLYNVKHNRFDRVQTLRGWMSNFFGLSVALGHGVLAVGAPEQVFLYEQLGSAEHPRFWHSQTLTDPSDNDNKRQKSMDLFGQHIALHEDTLVVGSYLKGASPGVSAGSAFVYVKDATSGKWVLQQELSGSNSVVQNQRA